MQTASVRDPNRVLNSGNSCQGFYRTRPLTEFRLLRDSENFSCGLACNKLISVIFVCCVGCRRKCDSLYHAAMDDSGHVQMDRQLYMCDAVWKDDMERALEMLEKGASINARGGSVCVLIENV